MKKRIIVTMLAGICCFVLAGCNNTKTTQSDEMQNEAVSEDEEDLADSKPEESEPTNPWSEYSGIYVGEILIKGIEGRKTVVKLDVSDYDVSGSSPVGSVYVSSSMIDKAELYYNGSNEVRENGTYVDTFYGEFGDSSKGTNAKTYYGFKEDDDGLVLDEYGFLDDGSELLIARLKQSEDGEKEINRIWNEDGSLKAPVELAMGEKVSEDNFEFSIDSYEKNLTEYRFGDSMTDNIGGPGLKIVKVTGTIRNLTGEEFEMASVYNENTTMELIVDDKYHYTDGTVTTYNDIYGTVMAGQEKTFYFGFAVPEDVIDNAYSVVLEFGFDEAFSYTPYEVSLDERKYRYSIELE